MPPTRPSARPQQRRVHGIVWRPAAASVGVEKKGRKKGRRPHPAEEAAIRRLHSRAHQAQAAGCLVERLAHHRARVVHQHHVPDLRTRPGSGGRRARAQPRAASGMSGALISVPGPHIARARTSVSAQLGRCVGGSMCRANTLAAPPACALSPCQPERERLGPAPGARGPQTCEVGTVCTEVASGALPDAGHLPAAAASLVACPASGSTGEAPRERAHA